MIKDLIDYLSDKNINILGFGREGQSTYKLIRKYLPNKIITISDLKENFQDNFDFLQNDKNLNLISGEKYLDNLERFDIIIKSPGISFAKIDITQFKDKISSQMEKGKSTTSSLIYTILKDQNKDVLLLGNIGKPIFDYINEISNTTILVLEMSAHQLEFMKYSPNISILLNLFEEHLDHYKSYEDYIAAKCNIYKYQHENDYFLYSLDNETLKEHVKNPKAKTYTISINEKADIYLQNDDVIFNNKKIYDRNQKRNLVGDYNLSNIMFTLVVSEILKLDLNKSINSINNFKTLKHRLEFVGNFDGINYYDNSIATVPMATIEAIKALKNVDTLIIGGMDRGIDYTDFIKYLDSSDISNIVCMPKTGHDIAKKLKNKKTFIVNTLEEAVDISKKVTGKNMSCLLSPAAASYGFFKNFEEKGDLFQKLVKQ